MKTNWNLKDKKVLITGGTKGIGKATVIEFLELGAKILFTARNKEEVSALESELQQGFSEIYGLATDVTIAQDIMKVKTWIETKWGTLDILVNNAGTNLRKPTVEYSKEDYRKVIETNITSVFYLNVSLFDLLKKAKKSSIINVASIAGMLDVQTGSPYGISKAGLLQLTRNLAVEWAEHGIRVNAISPWFTETPLTERLLSNESKISKVIERTPLKRIAQPEEMASAIAFLSMDKASYITGQNLVVDGGMTANAL